MRNHRLFSLMLALCLLLAGCTAGQTPSAGSQPESSSQSSEMAQEKPPLPIREDMYPAETVAQYFTAQRDEVPAGELTGEVVTRLWYLVNTLYDADDLVFVEDPTEPPEGFSAGMMVRFLDFEEATRYLFTDHGLDQLLAAELAGAPYIHQAENGEVYRRGAYKTGYSYQNAMAGYRVIHSDADSARVEVSWKIMSPIDWEQEHPVAFSTLYLKQEDGRWKVDGYNFPDAAYPEEFTIAEEIRFRLTDGEREAALSDAAQKEQLVAQLRALTQGVVTGEAPPQGCIAIEAVDNGRVYQMSVSPSGLVWDTLYAQEDWILYQAEPALYQELQALLP